MTDTAAPNWHTLRDALRAWIDAEREYYDTRVCLCEARIKAIDAARAVTADIFEADVHVHRAYRRLQQAEQAYSEAVANYDFTKSEPV